MMFRQTKEENSIRGSLLLFMNFKICSKHFANNIIRTHKPLEAAVLRR